MFSFVTKYTENDARNKMAGRSGERIPVHDEDGLSFRRAQARCRGLIHSPLLHNISFRCCCSRKRGKALGRFHGFPCRVYRKMATQCVGIVNVDMPQKKKARNCLRAYRVPPLGIEPGPSEPESEILSFKLQGHPVKGLQI